MRDHIRSFGVVLIVMALLAWAERAEAAPILTFGCQADCSTVNQGDTFDLEIRIEDVTDLVGFAFALTYSPSVIGISKPSDITYGSFLETNPLGPSVVSYSPVPCDQDPNLICAPPLLFGGTIAGQGAGATGTGVLARIRFEAVGVGNAGLAILPGSCDPLEDPECDPLLNLYFVNSDGIDIAPPIVNGRVVVESTVPVPEPATMSLLGLGLLGLARRLKSKRHRLT